MKRKIIYVWLVVLSTFTIGAHVPAYASNTNDTNKVFITGDYVYVKMPNGKEVIAIVRGKIADNKYYVRKYKSDLQGKVHKKHLRPIPNEEIEAIKARSSKRY